MTNEIKKYYETDQKQITGYFVSFLYTMEKKAVFLYVNIKENKIEY